MHTNADVLCWEEMKDWNASEASVAQQGRAVKYPAMARLRYILLLIIHNHRNTHTDSSCVPNMNKRSAELWRRELIHTRFQ